MQCRNPTILFFQRLQIRTSNRTHGAIINSRLMVSMLIRRPYSHLASGPTLGLFLINALDQGPTLRFISLSPSSPLPGRSSGALSWP